MPRECDAPQPCQVAPHATRARCGAVPTRSVPVCHVAPASCVRAGTRPNGTEPTRYIIQTGLPAPHPGARRKLQQNRTARAPDRSVGVAAMANGGDAETNCGGGGGGGGGARGRTGCRSVLVTGGAGFIGTHTVLRLLEQGYAVTAVDNFHNSVPEALDRVRRIAGPALSARLDFILVRARLFPLFRN